jgi:hypothetical protein
MCRICALDGGIAASRLFAAANAWRLDGQTRRLFCRRVFWGFGVMTDVLPNRVVELCWGMAGGGDH